MLPRIIGKIRFAPEIVLIEADSATYASIGTGFRVVTANGYEVSAAPLGEKRLASVLRG